MFTSVFIHDTMYLASEAHHLTTWALGAGKLVLYVYSKQSMVRRSFIKG